MSLGYLWIVWSWLTFYQVINLAATLSLPAAQMPKHANVESISCRTIQETNNIHSLMTWLGPSRLTTSVLKFLGIFWKIGVFDCSIWIGNLCLSSPITLYFLQSKSSKNLPVLLCSQIHLKNSPVTREHSPFFQNFQSQKTYVLFLEGVLSFQMSGYRAMYIAGNDIMRCVY